MAVGDTVASSYKVQRRGAIYSNDGSLILGPSLVVNYVVYYNLAHIKPWLKYATLKLPKRKPNRLSAKTLEELMEEDDSWTIR